MSIRDRAHPYVRPPNLVAGGVLAGAGAIAVATLGAPLVAGAVVIPLFVGAAAAVKAMRTHRDPPKPVRVDEAVQVEANLEQIEAQVAGKVPPAVQARVDRIIRTLRDTLPRLDQLGLGSAQAHAAITTATSYLPEALGSYLRLPRSYADERPIAGGKTSLMVLCDQLDLLGNKMDEVFVAVCQSDADALIAHGRFLAEKFASGSLALDGGSGSGSAGTAAVAGQLTPPLSPGGQPGPAAGGTATRP
jgi:hypothetical protein